MILSSRHPNLFIQIWFRHHIPSMSSFSTVSSWMLLHQWQLPTWSTMFNLRGHPLPKPMGNFRPTDLRFNQWTYSQLTMGSFIIIWPYIFTSTIVPHCLPPNTPINQAVPLGVNIPMDDKGKGDIYIDESIFVILNINDNIECSAESAPWATNTIAWPVSDSKPIPQKNLISPKKF